MSDPAYTDVESTVALVKRASCSHSDLGPTITRLFGEIASANPDAETASAPMVVYTGWRDSDCDIQVAFPVDPATVPGAGTELKTYPACTAIFASFAGPYTGLPQAWTDLWTYVQTNNVDVSGAPWDAYVKPPVDDAHPETAVTELYIPMR